MQITPRDYFLMPLFDANWPALIVVAITYIAIKKIFFKTHKVSIIYSIVIIFYSAVATLPLQSLAALKLWKVSDTAVLNYVFPICAFFGTVPAAYLLLRLHVRISGWWAARKAKRLTSGT